MTMNRAVSPQIANSSFTLPDIRNRASFRHIEILKNGGFQQFVEAYIASLTTQPAILTDIQEAAQDLVDLWLSAAQIITWIDSPDHSDRIQAQAQLGGVCLMEEYLGGKAEPAIEREQALRIAESALKHNAGSEQIIEAPDYLAAVAPAPRTLTLAMKYLRERTLTPTGPQG